MLPYALRKARSHAHRLSLRPRVSHGAQPPLERGDEERLRADPTDRSTIDQAERATPPIDASAHARDPLKTKAPHEADGGALQARATL